MYPKYKTLGEIIRERGLSYAKLEDLCGIPKSSIQRFAVGQTKRVDLSSVKAIGKALSIDPYYLLGDPEVVTSLESLGYTVSVIPNGRVRVSDDMDVGVYEDFEPDEFDRFAQTADFQSVYDRLRPRDKKETPTLSEEDERKNIMEMLDDLSAAELVELMAKASAKLKEKGLA
mgnify:CR=1 FL=1